MLPSAPVFEILVAVALVWLTVLSVVVYRVSEHYRRLLGKTGKEDLKSVLEVLLAGQGKSDASLKKFEQSVTELNKEIQSHIQKVGIVKFNPFQDTGSNQSFALCFLDGQDNGVVILSLHGREGTRIYLKPIQAGKSKFELSSEEKQAIEGARKSG